MIISCKYCHNDFDVPVTPEQIRRWRNGGLIQRIMPNLSADQRELLMTRTCGTCFDKMFPAVEDETGLDQAAKGEFQAADITDAKLPID